MQFLIPAGHDAVLDQNEPVVLVPGFCRRDRAFGLTCGANDGGHGGDGGDGGGGYEDGDEDGGGGEFDWDRDRLELILRSGLVRSRQVCPNDPLWINLP